MQILLAAVVGACERDFLGEFSSVCLEDIRLAEQSLQDGVFRAVFANLSALVLRTVLAGQSFADSALPGCDSEHLADLADQIFELVRVLVAKVKQRGLQL